MPDLRSSRFREHPYAGFLHEIDKPARYVGGEWGQRRKPWNTTRIRTCLAFPDLYDIGMSHLGTRILYHVLNEPGDMLCERAFVPWTDLHRALRQRGMPIVSLENARPLSDFHVVGISLQHELVYTNVLTLLDLGGIPLRAEHREDHHPLVLGGGSVASHPEPVAPFFDAFVLGDGEHKAEEVVRRWVDDLERGVARSERLARLAVLGGVYVPSLYACRYDDLARREVVERALCDAAPLPVSRAVVPDLDDHPFPVAFPAGGPEAVFDRLSIEIARGCSQGCRFCQGGMIFRPERERDPRRVVDTIRQSLQHSGQDEVSLTSLSPADYSAIAPLVRAVSDAHGLENVALNVSSLRAYGLEDATLDEIRRVRASNLTFAPEAGSQRLRDVINKNISEEQLLSTVQRVVTRGWERIKLYFMIGLPTETDDDVDAIVELTARARGVARASRKKGRPTQVTASASTFVPKPHTPFQWFGMADLDTILHKHRKLVLGARNRKVDVKMHEPHGSVLEGILSRGDRRLADVIEDAWRAGSRFDAWDGNVDWGVWTEAMDRRGLDVAAYLSDMEVEARLPWSHLDMGVHPDFLRKERDKALRPAATLPCLRPAPNSSDSSKLVCYQCGAECDLDQAAERRRQLAEALLAPDNPPAGKHDKPAAEPFRYRLRYEKLGRAVLLGHLDLVREVPRILRRAGVPLWYSQGFHPKPVMTFGPALSLGVPSFEEYVDIKTVEPVEVSGWIPRINEVCPDGIRFVEAAALPKGAPVVVNELAEAEVLVGLDRRQVDDAGGTPWLEDRLRAILDAPELIVSRRSKKKERRMDVRPFVNDLGLAGEGAAARMAEAGVPGAWEIAYLRHGISAQGTIRLDELVELAGDGRPLTHRAVRLSLRAEGGASVMPGDR